MYDINGGSERQITTGNWDVTKLYGLDQKKGIVYYQSAETNPTQRDVYSMRVKGTDKAKLSSAAGTNDAVFSKSFDYFVNYFSNANTPYTNTLNDEKGKMVRELKNNNALITLMGQYGFAKREMFTLKTDENTSLNAWMIKPKDFDPNKKYPVLMYVYGGPGSQTVIDAFDYQTIWFQMLAQKGYIIVSVDNRGTGARGAEFKKMTPKDKNMKFNFGIGVDIEDADRFRKIKKNSRLLNKIFTRAELTYCLAKEDSAQHLAARWAAKEAVFKSLNNLGYGQMDYKKIEVMNDLEGIPQIKLNGQGFKNLAAKISLSHSDNIAIAFAILINKTK